MSKKVKEGNMIKLVIYFHTSSGGLNLPPKTALKSGVIYMPTNHKHGIRTSSEGRTFFSKNQGSIVSAIKDCLKKNGIKLVEEGKEGELKRFLEMQNKQEFYDEEMKI